MLKPHRGGMILAFGILGLVVCFILGIFAWIMGNNDLAEMRAGTMDPSGEGLTQAGRIIGMITCILTIAGFCIGGGVFALMVVGAAASGAG